MFILKTGLEQNFHLHDGNQVLIVTEGKGSLEMFKRFGSNKTNFEIKRTEKITLNEGDIVHIPARTLHTHGSIEKKTTFAHIAINILSRKNAPYKTTWYDSDFKSKVLQII